MKPSVSVSDSMMVVLTRSEAKIKRYVDLIRVRAEWHRKNGCLEGQSFRIHLLMDWEAVI